MEQRRVRILVGFGIVASIIFFTFADLQTSLFLFSPQSLFGLFFDAFGAWPAPFFGLLASAVVVSTQAYTGVAAKVYSLFFGFLAIAGGTVTIYLPFHYAYRVRFSPTFIIPGAMLALLAVLLFRGLPASRRTDVRTVAYAVILVILFQLLTVNVLKFFWGRVRFRDMDAPFLSFTSWYLPQGPTGNRSFPSGHTGNAAVSFSLIYLRHLMPRRRLLPLLWIVPFVWTGLVALSRVVLGYHFATDVIFAWLITLACVFLFDRLILRRQKTPDRPSAG